MNPRYWIGAVGVLLASSLWFTMRNQLGGAPKEELLGSVHAARIVPESAAPPAASVAALSHDPEPAAAPTASPTPQKPTEDPETALFKPDKFSVEQALQRAAERKELNDRWQSQKEDRPWAAETKGRVQALLRKANLRPQALREVDCRETICRFSLHAETSLQKDVGNMIHAARDLERETWLMPEPSEQANGAWDIEVYFPRAGYMLSGGGGRIETAAADTEK
jgi:hypothetical protein